MDSLKLWARNGDAVRQAIELGEIAHIETASEELTDEFLLFAIDSGLLKSWCAPQIFYLHALPGFLRFRPHSFMTHTALDIRPRSRNN